MAEAHETAIEHADPCTDLGEGDWSEICWSLSDNEYQHRELAERHRRLADAHADAAEALKAAEATACAEVPQSERDISPFLRFRDILSVEALSPHSATTVKDIPVAKVTFRKVPGLRQETLQNIVDCHIARNAALGHNVPEMEDCPLVPAGVTASVAPGSDAKTLVVTISASEASFEDVRERLDELEEQVPE